jgi:ribonuclease D
MNHGAAPTESRKQGWLSTFFGRLLGRRQPLAPLQEPTTSAKRRASKQRTPKAHGTPVSGQSTRPRSQRPPPVRATPKSSVCHTPFHMISTTSELENAVTEFVQHPRIALDTEADSLHCYFDKLCLLQISIPGSNFLIDPLADVSLDPLFRALEGKTVVIHSADYDLRLLRRVGYTGPTVLFDTMIGARLCGATEFGLASLLHQHFGVTLAKASQKANWARRPLPPEMLEYAVNDTLNLLTLAQIQEDRLRELGRWEWFGQMCEKQIRSSSIVKDRDPDTLWRISGYAELSPRGAAILRALWFWRDQEARSVDKPAFHILGNDMLLDVANRFDKGQTVDPRHLRGSRWNRLLEAAETALKLPEQDWPTPIRKPRLRTTQEQEARFKELRNRRDAAAEELELDPTLIAPKATLEQLSRREPLAFESLLPWQSECLGLAGEMP